MKARDILEDRRKSLNLSPEQAAGRVGISRRQWDRILKKCPQLPLKTAIQIEAGLGVPLVQLAHAEDFALDSRVEK